MKLHVTFKQQNPNFDKDYANEYQFGNESNGNQKDILSIRLSVPKEIDKIAITEKGKLSLYGNTASGKEINLILPNMTILECFKDDEVVAKFAVSKVLIKNIHKAYNEKYDTTRFYFYFKERKDYIQLGENTYVVEEDIPNEL